MINLKKLILGAVAAVTVSSASAAVSVIWDFTGGDDNGWTTVNGAAWLASGGLEAGQEDGIGGNATGATRRAHDGAHANFIARSPALNFSSVHPTDPVLEFDLFGGDGNQDSAADPTDPASFISGGAGLTSAVGQKGVALLNLTTGNYDAAFYRAGNASNAQVFSLTMADLTTAGVTTTDDYQLDFFESDDGGWGWSRLDAVRLDADAVVVPEPSSTALFGLAGLLVFIRRRK